VRLKVFEKLSRGIGKKQYESIHFTPFYVKPIILVPVFIIVGGGEHGNKFLASYPEKFWQTQI
jgi:hypothetical protein